MKIKKVIFSVLFATAIFLTGCNGYETTTGSGSINGQDIKITLTYKDDNVVKQLIEKETPYSALGEDITADTAEQLAKQQQEIYNQMQGVTYSFKTSGDKISEKIEMDFQKADIAMLRDSGVIESSVAVSDENGENMTVSLKAAISAYESANIKFE